MPPLLDGMRGPRASGSTAAVRPSGPAAERFERTLLLCTRGVKARHRHLLRDLLQLLPHGKLGSKLPTDDGLSGVLELCEDGGCGSALLLDARDPRRLFLWAANCPDGPSAMFQVVNTHTVAELKFDARRVSGARNVLVFDPAFNESSEMRVLKALLTSAFAVPGDAAATTSGAPLPARHSVSFAWLDGRVWMRVYRIETNPAGNLDVAEIGPRLVLLPTRIIASGFGGAILQVCLPLPTRAATLAMAVRAMAILTVASLPPVATVLSCWSAPCLLPSPHSPYSLHSSHSPTRPTHHRTHPTHPTHPTRRARRCLPPYDTPLMLQERALLTTHHLLTTYVLPTYYPRLCCRSVRTPPRDQRVWARLHPRQSIPLPSRRDASYIEHST